MDSLQHSMNKILSHKTTVSQLMSSSGYAYVGYLQLPWEREEENEGHSPDYLKWTKKVSSEDSNYS